MSDSLRMGYVGCGFMAQKVHIPNILSLPECRLVAIAEVRPKLGEMVRDRLRIPKLYPSHREMAEDPNIRAVAVSGHFSGHGEIAIDLLRAGKDVFMEKPMATSVEQAKRILEAERDSGQRLMIGYMKRYDAGNLLLKELLDGFRESGELGAVRYVRNHGFCGDWTAGLDMPMLSTTEPVPNVPTSWPDWLPEDFRNGYVGYLQQYTHNINLMRWLLDAGDDAQVKAVDLERDGLTGVAILNVAGCRAIVESGNVAYHGWDEHTQIYFEQGWLRSCAPPLLLRNMPATVEVYRADVQHKTTSELFPAAGWTWSYKEEMRHFVKCVSAGEPFRSPASDAITDVRLLEDICRCHVQACA